MFLDKSAVTKHGSHNQQSHAGSRGRGGAGSQSLTTTGNRNPDTNAQLGKDVDSYAKEYKSVIDGLAKDVTTAARESELLSEAKNLSQTVKYLNEASKMADKIVGNKSNKVKIQTLNKLTEKLGQAYNKAGDSDFAKPLESLTADALDAAETVMASFVGMTERLNTPGSGM